VYDNIIEKHFIVSQNSILFILIDIKGNTVHVEFATQNSILFILIGGVHIQGTVHDDAQNSILFILIANPSGKRRNQSTASKFHSVYINSILPVLCKCIYQFSQNSILFILIANELYNVGINTMYSKFHSVYINSRYQRLLETARKINHFLSTPC